MATLAQLQHDREEYVANLNDVEEILASMPDMEDALAMKSELTAKLDVVDAKIAALTEKTASPVIASPVDASFEVDKWSTEDHSAFRTSVNPSPAEEKKALHTFKVNDTVTAKYAGDKQFYEARIISITGSSINPIYTVNFKGYAGTETVRSHEIRPIAAPAATSQKRKADDSPAASNTATSLPSTPVPGVISAAASIDPEKANALRKESTKTLDGGSKPKAAKKARTNKALESSKNSWQAWQNAAATGKKVAKVAVKESMFRTGEAPTARVGFTGSGQTMRKDAARARHNYTLDD